ncbi:sugar ABC transporter ATP-binding protein [Nocardioides aquiterrae]|uniref:Sugar ABC transporter ATP-binding protein n=1 Tax=Nocardioides aquiterrae TaxID=203799 RepID=A0ABP4EPT1_9ACTN
MTHQIPALEMTGISKRFPGVVALDAVDFQLLQGETHVLFGENGAGKSTLISIMAGAASSDSGTVRLAGRETSLRNVADARRLGVSAVFQEFSLAPTLSVAENVVMGEQPSRAGVVSHRAVRELAHRRLGELGFEIPLDAPVETLTRAEQQMVEIAKAFRSDLKVLILDEPTASLNDTECERLYELVGDLNRRGVGVVYVTHRMGEIRRLADRVTVLRDGRYVTTVPGTTSSEELIRLMTGRVMDQIYPTIPPPTSTVALSAVGLTTRDQAVSDASFEVRKGEIVGFAGLMGSGKSHAARACAGVERLAAGHLELHGRRVTGASVAQSLRNRVVYLPPDRKSEGLLLNRPLRESVSLPWLGRYSWARTLVRRRSEQRDVADVLRMMKLSPPDPDRNAEAYSGGNQQKALLGRALLRECEVLLLDEPTVGVDVGARVSIYQRVADIAEGGAGVVIVSSDLPEVLHLCHRVYVFCQGRITAHLQGDEINEERVLQHMMHWDETEAVG